MSSHRFQDSTGAASILRGGGTMPFDLLQKDDLASLFLFAGREKGKGAGKGCPMHDPPASTAILNRVHPRP